MTAEWWPEAWTHDPLRGAAFTRSSPPNKIGSPHWTRIAYIYLQSNIVDVYGFYICRTAYVARVRVAQAGTRPYSFGVCSLRVICFVDEHHSEHIPLMGYIRRLWPLWLQRRCACPPYCVFPAKLFLLPPFPQNARTRSGPVIASQPLPIT